MPQDQARRDPVTFFVFRGYGTGGVARTVFAVADELHRRGHPVEVVSGIREAKEPRFPVEPGVRVSFLIDRFDPDNPEGIKRRPRKRLRSMLSVAGILDRLPSGLGKGTGKIFSRLADVRLRRKMRSIQDGIVVTTRAELGIAAARWTRPNVLRIHQEHLAFSSRAPELLQDLVSVSPRLDALLALTEADEKRWSGTAAGSQTIVAHIPNASPFPVADPAPLENKIVLAAGRLVPQKGFDLLIDAYAPLAEKFPDWQVHIYGEGPIRKTLEQQIHELGLEKNVLLMGFSDQFLSRLREVSIFALSSRHEGMPMVLLEAMSQGIPRISFDCPTGPSQLIEDGVDGLLIPDGDIEAFREGLATLMGDDAMRHRLAHAALKTAESFQIESVTDEWQQMFARVAAARAR
jgi:glycosyltransferase involved in cell wall biosynthesis